MSFFKEPVNQEGRRPSQAGDNVNDLGMTKGHLVIGKGDIVDIFPTILANLENHALTINTRVFEVLLLFIIGNS